MLFVTATDTGVGKTFYSSQIIKDLIREGSFKANEMAYFKPIQCGLDPSTDYDEIKKENPQIEVFCSYCLNYPASPDYAASLEEVKISLDKIAQDFIDLKKKFKFIVVEGAGGLAVPINDKDYISDIAVKLDLPCVLVVRPNLGTINHSLLSIEHIKNKGLKLLGIIVTEFLKDENFIARDKAAIEDILKHSEQKLFTLDCIKEN